jgi:diaminopimelate epimerase
MDLPFYKYQGTANDFILVDNRKAYLTGEENDFFQAICHRRYGIGADGVILLNEHPGYDFAMDYFNSDGKRSSMCGNGGRCIVRFAADLGLITNEAKFLAVDGEHYAVVNEEAVKIKMAMPTGYREVEVDNYWIDTGSPHYIQLLGTPVAEHDVVNHGRAIRESEAWKENGTNVNFVQVVNPGEAHVRTYERGVEDETWSCGTGVTAVAEVMARIFPDSPAVKLLHTLGGTLKVHTQAGAEPWLDGPAMYVFHGTVPMP